jgi:hypothetical protein
LEANVLPKAAAVVEKLAARFDKGDNDPEVRLVGAIETWYLGGNDKRIIYHPIVSYESLKAARLPAYLPEGGQSPDLENAERRLRNKLRSALPPGLGYTCEVNVNTLDAITAADLLEWSEWIFEQPGSLLD